MKQLEKAEEWIRDNPIIIAGFGSLVFIGLLIYDTWYDVLQYRYEVQVILTTVMAVLAVEMVTITDPKSLMTSLREFDKTAAQILILGSMIVAAVVTNQAIWYVEGLIGDIYLTSLLGILVLISRFYVNISAHNPATSRGRFSSRGADPEPILGILDGQRDTYAVYVFGLVAIFLPYLLQRVYPLDHNFMSATTIAVAFVVSSSYYFYPDLEEMQEDF